MLTRLAEDRLTEWLSGQRRKPLVLRGARQVGKSTLVRQFAAHQGKVLNEVNLERYLALDSVFASLDVRAVLRELEVVSGAPIRADASLLFLDEIQATPRALQALRYLHEELPELPVVAAGSLLEFTLANHAVPMPVGRIQYMHLGPMTLREFLAAVEPELVPYLSQFTPTDPLPATAHGKLLDRQRQFMFVGGMPEAVQVFQESGSPQDVSAVHRSIAETYLDDFSKYARQKELLLLQKVFRALPRDLGQKVKYSRLSPDDRAKDVRSAIDLLTKARLCHPVYHSHCSGLPLLAEISEADYKLIFLDIGMVNHLCGNDWLALRSTSERNLVNEGGLAEQFIGQHLAGLSEELGPPRLTYWLREGKAANAEVDYVWSRGNWIIPIEVKAGPSGALRSLQQFVLHRRPPLAVRFDLNPPSLQRAVHVARTATGSDEVSFDLLSLPLYAVEELPRLVDRLREQTAQDAEEEPLPCRSST
jgi:predicted AAA+ superfamily ATPase